MLPFWEFYAESGKLIYWECCTIQKWFYRKLQLATVTMVAHRQPVLCKPFLMISVLSLVQGHWILSVRSAATLLPPPSSTRDDSALCHQAPWWHGWGVKGNNCCALFSVVHYLSGSWLRASQKGKRAFARWGLKSPSLSPYPRRGSAESESVRVSSCCAAGLDVRFLCGLFTHSAKWLLPQVIWSVAVF